eukprot:scaffold21969_cov59-Attheya_sp.AAC.1
MQHLGLPPTDNGGQLVAHYLPQKAYCPALQCSSSSHACTITGQPQNCRHDGRLSFCPRDREKARKVIRRQAILGYLLELFPIRCVPNCWEASVPLCDRLDLVRERVRRAIHGLLPQPSRNRSR